AADRSVALGFFLQWIARLRNEGLNIASRLIATNVGEAVHSLREGSCDLMLAFYDPDAGNAPPRRRWWRSAGWRCSAPR
ncbi:hypothetical protein ACLBV4_36640, partial [Pseudomonas aeruginosa]